MVLRDATPKGLVTLGDVGDLWLDHVSFAPQLVAGDLDHVMDVKTSGADDFGRDEAGVR